MEQQGQGVVSGEASKRHLIVPFSRGRGGKRSSDQSWQQRAERCKMQKSESEMTQKESPDKHLGHAASFVSTDVYIMISNCLSG